MGAERRGVFARWSARRRYADAADEARLAWEGFVDTDPGARREVLLWASDCERAMAASAFGLRGAGRVDEDGFTVAGSHEMAALLLAVVADTEHPPQRIRRSFLDEDRMVAGYLLMLSLATDMVARAELTLMLHDAVTGQVGRQAAEILAADVAYGYYRLAGVPEREARWRTGPHGPGWNR